MKHLSLFFLFFCPFLLKAQSANDHLGYAANYFNQRNFHEAINSYNRAISLQPSAEAYHNRALAKLESYDYTGAVQDLSQAIRMKPGSRVHYNVRAAAYKLLKDVDGAIRDYSSMINLNSGDYEAYANRVDLLLDAARHKEAVKDLTVLIKNNASDNIAFRHWQRGRSYLEMGKFREALSDFNTTLKMKPEYGEVYLERAEANYELKNFKDACADLEKASAQGYENSRLAFGMGCL